MGSTFKLFHTLSVLSAVASVNAVPSGSKLDSNSFENVERLVYKRQDVGGLIDTCDLCPVVRRLSSFLPADIQNQANGINNQVRDLIAQVGPTLPGGIPALDSLLSNPTDVLGEALPADLPGTDALSGLPAVSGLTSALPTGLANAVPTDLTDALLTDAVGLLPTNVVGDLLNGSVPTDALGALPVPTDALGAVPGALPTGLPTDAVDDLGGGLPTDLADNLPVPTDALGAVPGVADVLSNPTDPLSNLGDLDSALLVAGALPTDVLSNPTDALGDLGNLASTLPVPTDALSTLPVPTDVLGAVPGVGDVLSGGGLPTDGLGNVSGAGDLGAVPGVGDLASGLPTGALDGVTGALPTDLANGLPALGDPVSGLPAVEDLTEGLPTGASPTDLPAVGDLANGLPTGALEGVTGALPTDVLSAVPGLNNVIGSGLPTNALGALPIPTDTLGGFTNPTGLLGGVTNAVSTSAAGDLLGGAPAIGGLLGGATNPTGLLGGLTSAAPAVPAATGLLGGVTSPRVPKVIQSGTVVDKAYNWSFYNNGAVQIDKNFLFPRQGVLSGLLPDRTFSGLFADGLHIGDHIVPYPAGYLPLLSGVKLPLAPPSLLNLVPDLDDDTKR
jgi:hypothetical protein